MRRRRGEFSSVLLTESTSRTMISDGSHGGQGCNSNAEECHRKSFLKRLIKLFGQFGPVLGKLLCKDNQVWQKYEVLVLTKLGNFPRLSIDTDLAQFPNRHGSK